MKKTILILNLLLLFISCSKNSDSSSSPINGNLTINGVVVDENNIPINGAVVKCGSSLGNTNSNGEYTLTNVVFQERVVVEVNATGFFDGYRGMNPIDGQTQKLNVMMESKGTPIIFNTSSGGILSNQGGTLNISANTVIDANGNLYNGVVTAYLRFHNPSQGNFGKIMQGGDFAGENTSGVKGVLSSYGFYSVAIEDNSGNKLNIKSDSTASFSMPIATSQAATAPSNIKLWSFDKTKGMWKEEGTATKSGNNYLGLVRQIAFWNCDQFNEFYNLKGRVMCNGIGVSKLVTVADAISGSVLTTLSGSDGYFSIRVPQYVAVNVTIQGNTFAVGPQSTSSDLDLGNLEICNVVPNGNCAADRLTLLNLLTNGSSAIWIASSCETCNYGLTSITFNNNYTGTFTIKDALGVGVSHTFAMSWQLSSGDSNCSYAITYSNIDSWTYNGQTVAVGDAGDIIQVSRPYTGNVLHDTFAAAGGCNNCNANDFYLTKQ